MAEDKVKPEAKPMDKTAAPVQDKPKPAKKSSPEALMTSESPKKSAPKSAGKSKGGGFTETRVHHLNGGGHHVHHLHKDGSDKDMHYAAQDLEAVKQGLDSHIGGGASAAMESPEPPPTAGAEPAMAAPPAAAMPQQV